MKGSIYIKKIFTPVYKVLKKKIVGSGNSISKKSLPAKLSIEIRGNNNQIKLDENSHLGNLKFFIYGNNNKIEISKNCIIKSGTFWIEDDNCEIFIDSKTTIESVDFGVSENNSKVYIGKDCMLSSGVKFKTGDSHSILDAEGKRINFAGDIYIGNHVWIGQDVVLLKNSIIKDESIIGLRSVISNKEFEKNSLIVGMPAKVIKENINWLRERI